MSYYNGYSNGVKAKYIIKPNLLTAELAFTTAAPLEQKNLQFSPLNYAVIGRLGWQPAFFWQQGLSFSYGTFFREDDLNDLLDQQFMAVDAGHRL